MTVHTIPNPAVFDQATVSPGTGKAPPEMPRAWRDLLAAGIRTPARLPDSLGGGNAALKPVCDRFPMWINAHFFSLIQGPDDPLGRQVLPRCCEMADDLGSWDPLGEEAQAPVSQVIHRYPHRVAFLISNQCAVYCRFCMRKRRLGASRQVTAAQIESGLDYIRRHPEINEVLLTGGDPLMLSDQRLFSILKALREIRHVRFLRIHSRMAGVLPQRITSRLAQGLAASPPLFINLHFNHPAEITPESQDACRRLADAGIPLGSQTVLLQGINDDAAVLTSLFENLLAMRVKPYYLHQLDHIPGTAHFRVPLEKGLQLLTSLRGPLSGMAIPHFMVDLPQGGGKVALTPDMVVQKDADQWRIRNWQGKLITYPLKNSQ